MIYSGSPTALDSEDEEEMLINATQYMQNEADRTRSGFTGTFKQAGQGYEYTAYTIPGRGAGAFAVPDPDGGAGPNQRRKGPAANNSGNIGGAGGGAGGGNGGGGSGFYGTGAMGTANTGGGGAGGGGGNAGGSGGSGIVIIRYLT